MSRVRLPDTSEIVAEAPHLFETLSVGDLNAAHALGNAPHALAGCLGYMDGLTPRCRSNSANLRF